VFPKAKLKAISPHALSHDPQIVSTLTYCIYGCVGEYEQYPIMPVRKPGTQCQM